MNVKSTAATAPKLASTESSSAQRLPTVVAPDPVYSKPRSSSKRRLSSASNGRATASAITIYGATSFVAKHVITYLMQSSLSLPGRVIITLAGRNPEKLELLRQDFSQKIDHLETIHADATGTCEFDTWIAESSDAAKLLAMASRTKLVINCAGPFAEYGSNVVAACAQIGTDYVDITGEISWAGDMRSRYSKTATKFGARLVSFCGFDSVPSDMAVLAAVRAIQTTSTRKNKRVDVDSATTWHSTMGFFNGGSIQTMLGVPLNLSRCLLRRVPFLLDDPLVLAHPRKRNDPNMRGARDRMAVAEWKNQLPRFHSMFRRGASAPFFMAPVNTKVVNASSVALKYGRNFVYYERHIPAGFKFTTRLGTLSIIPALVTQIGALAGMAVLRLPILGRFLANWLAPAGSGASDDSLRTGYVEVYAEVTSTVSEDDSSTAHKANCFLKFEGDPGNMVTAQCVSEAALTLLYNRDELPPRSKDGFGTPAELLGMPYLKRLQNSPIRPVTVETHVRKDVRDKEWRMFPRQVAEKYQ